MPSKVDKPKLVLRNKKTTNYRRGKNPEPSSSDDSSNDEDYSTVSEEEEESSETEYVGESSETEESSSDFDRKKFQRVLAKMFPSKYMNEKVSSKKPPSPKSKKSTSKKSSDRRRRNRDLSDSEDEDIDIEDTEEEESEYETDDEEELEDTPEKQKKYNIIFRIGGANNDDDYFEDGNEDEYEESDEDEMCDSDDEKTFMRENYVEEEAVKPVELEKPVKRSSDKKKSKAKESSSDPEMEDIESEYLELVDLKKRLSQELVNKPKNKILKNSIQDCKDSIRALIKKARKANTKKYHKLIHEDTKPSNEMDYFKTKLSNKEQRKAMEDLKEINAHIYTDKPYRLSLLQSKMPARFKAVAMQKLNVLKSMDPSDHEYYKIKSWVDTFMRIPFGLYKNVSVSMSDGLPKCNEFMTDAKKTLDECVFGLNDAKMQIMQMLGQLVVNPQSVGTAIAIHGPMGTGKTTLVKEGISKILGREFAFIALGGSGDASFLEGHSYTYEGSTWGKIVQIIIESKCMNPVIYFDELDKVSDTARGQEIIGILTHLTDTSQNNQFHDKYFAEIDFDLSKCLFIFSYNDENAINPILRDRMYRIRTKGYDAKDKITIARDHLLPKIREQVKFTAEDVLIPDEMIKYIISTFTKNESGVRNLKRCLEMIYSKLNLFRLVSPENKMFVKEMDLNVSFPITITKKEIDVFIKSDEVVNQTLLSMYI
jgi:ATP-dependent Lon protease